MTDVSNHTNSLELYDGTTTQPQTHPPLLKRKWRTIIAVQFVHQFTQASSRIDLNTLVFLILGPLSPDIHFAGNQFHDRVFSGTNNRLIHACKDEGGFLHRWLMPKLRRHQPS